MEQDQWSADTQQDVWGEISIYLPLSFFLLVPVIQNDTRLFSWEVLIRCNSESNEVKRVFCVIVAETH